MVGIYTIDVSLMSDESKENSNSWMWYALVVKVVCFSQQNLKVNCIILFSPKGYWAAYSVFLLSDSMFRTISCNHSLVALFVEIMLTASFC